MTALAVFAAGLLVATVQPEWLPEALRPAEPPILVFLVPDQRAVDDIRQAVSPERVVVDTPDAIALVEGRIMGTGPDAVSEPLNEAGWVDRDVEIYTVAPKDWLGTRRHAGSGGVPEGWDEGQLERLKAVARKPTLNAGEQMLVLKAMNDGVAF